MDLEVGYRERCTHKAEWGGEAFAWLIVNLELNSSVVVFEAATLFRGQLNAGVVWVCQTWSCLLSVRCGNLGLLSFIL